MKENILKNIRNRLIDLTLLALVLLMIPIILSSFYRNSKTGFEIIQLVSPMLLIFTSVIYFLRNRIPTQFKIYTFLGFLILNSFFAFWSYGLLSMGVSLLLLMATSAILLLDKKSIIKILILIIFFFCGFAVAYTKGWLSYHRDVELYATSFSTWFTQFVSFVAILLVVYFSLTYTIESLQKVLLENQKLYEKRQEELEKLVEERTVQLEETLSTLMQKEKMASLGNLVAGVAHEINTPLGVAITANSFISDRYKTIQKKIDENTLKKSELDDFLFNINETSQILEETLYRAAELVKSFKKISVHHASNYKTLFNLTEYIDSTILTLKHEYKNTGTQILFDASTPYWVESDPSVFSQLFTNLILNALIHGLKHSEHGIIKINLEPIDTGLKISFSDNGSGIPQELQNKVFDPFFTTNRNNGGSGLGLSIVHSIITEYLKGSIQLISNANEGTTFIMKLPLILHKNKKDT
ncbi:MAG: HAMP domain-containing histidine kinase [Candidatus Delongbacteria bacterium]|nr:HAMP domain-containing histidine kinase [Candidatus Delongbacteria bacterium]